MIPGRGKYLLVGGLCTRGKLPKKAQPRAAHHPVTVSVAGIIIAVRGCTNFVTTIGIPPSTLTVSQSGQRHCHFRALVPNLSFSPHPDPYASR